MNLPRTWPGVPQSMWPALNRLAEGVETALNWRTDGSLEVQVQGGYMTASVPPPTDFDTLILAGTNPYCWAKLAQFNDGKWYVDTLTPLVGWIDGYGVAALAGISWLSGTATFTLQGVASVPFTAGTQVTIKGTNPVAWDADYTVVAVNQQELSFTATVAADPGTYVTGGAVVGTVTDAKAFRPGYEYNENSKVRAGIRSRMRVHILNAEDSSEGAEDAPEYEHQFEYCCTNTVLNGAGTPITLIETTKTLNLSSNINNNLNTTGTSTFYIYPGPNNVTITGWSGGQCGKVIEIVNSSDTAGGKTITVVSDGGTSNPSSSSENQYSGANAANDVIGPQSTATYVYDCTKNRWVKKGGGGTSGGSWVVGDTGVVEAEDALKTYFDVTIPPGVAAGYFSWSGTGSNNADWYVLFEDIYGNSETVNNTTITTPFYHQNTPNSWNQNLSAFGSVKPPVKRIRLQAQNRSAGNPANIRVTWKLG